MGGGVCNGISNETFHLDFFDFFEGRDEEASVDSRFLPLSDKTSPVGDVD